MKASSLKGGGEGGVDRRWRGAVTGGGERLLVEGSGFRSRGVVSRGAASGGEERS